MKKQVTIMLLVFGSIFGSTEGKNPYLTNEKKTSSANKATNIEQGTLNITTRDKQARHSLFFAKYEIYDNQNKLVGSGQVQTNGIHVDSLISKPVSLNLPFGTYTIKETEAPSLDYQVSKPIEVVFSENNQEVTFLSQPQTGGSITIKIEDEDTQAPLSTGRYVIVNWKNDTILPPTQPQNNTIALSNLTYGWYVVQEAETPKGHISDKYRSHQVLIDNRNPKATTTFRNKAGEPTPPTYPQSVDLEFTTSDGRWGTATQNMKGVRIGEYMWTDQHLQTNNLSTLQKDMNSTTDAFRSITKEQIDEIHKHMAMFNYHRRPDSPNQLLRPTYWAYGISVEDVNKNYGGVFNQAYFNDWQIDGSQSYGNGRHRLSETTLRTIVKHGNIYIRDVKLEMKENNTVNHNWRLPLGADLRQLVGMCGEGSLREMRQHLSWGFDDSSAPSVVKATNSIRLGGTPAYMVNNYFEWFDHSVSDPRTNKYGFNLVPAGWRQHEGTGTPPPTSHYDHLSYPYTVEEGGFIIHNQVFRLKGGDGTCLELSDQTNMIYDIYDFAQYPIRFCRPMTDEELGYKLWVNFNIHEEEDFLGSIANGRILAKDVHIAKTSLNEQPSLDEEWYELPRGYIRGAYVQYILDQPKPEKSIKDILELGYIKHAKNTSNNGIAQGLWRNCFTATGIEEENNDSESANRVQIAPTVVVDRINISGHEDVNKFYLFDTSGSLLIRKAEVASTLDLSHLPSGIYFLRFETDKQAYTHKIVKK